LTAAAHAGGGVVRGRDAAGRCGHPAGGFGADRVAVVPQLVHRWAGRADRRCAVGAHGSVVGRAVGRGGDSAGGARERERVGAWICFQDESGFSLLPVVRGTWAPRGQTPVLTHRFSWSRMSMAGVLAYRPDRSRAKLIFQTKPGSYNTASLIEYLTDLRRHLRGKPVILIWDGLSAHRSKDMKAWLASQRHW